MDNDANSNNVQAVPASDCPLSHSEQTRNLVIYGVNVSLVYLASPTLYVGLVHAALLEKLGGDKTLMNLPTSVYFWCTPFPLLAAWYFCSVRQLKPVVIVSYVISALASAGVVAVLMLPLEKDLQFHWVTTAALLQSGLMGSLLGVVANFQWEVLGRGVAESRRGQALALAFGVGPILAFLAALATQVLLTRVIFPWNFAALFGITVPAMLLAAILSSWFVVPNPHIDVQRQSFVKGVLGGIGEFVRYRLTRLAAIATFMVACGYNIITNFTAFTQEAVGQQAAEYVGYQNAMRFGFKVLAGLFLGWLLTRTHAKAGLLVTGAFCLSSVIWILFAPGMWFLVSFGLMGAGELWGVYYPNYILNSSPKSRMRRNMAIVSLIYMPTGFAALLFGAIADAFDLRTSFYVAILVLVATLLFVQFFLPARPRPPWPDEDAEIQESGIRSQESGMRKPETGIRRQETGITDS